MGIELDAVLGKFVPQRLHILLEGTERDYGSTATTDHEATYIHEQIHFFQTAMTGYGQTAWELHRQMTGYLVHEWSKETDSTPNARLFPLANLAHTESGFAISEVSHLTSLEIITLMTARHRTESKLAAGNITDLKLKLCKFDWKLNPEIEVQAPSLRKVVA